MHSNADSSLTARRAIAVSLCAAVWLAAHLPTLARFPPMHSDEAWLASLTHSMLAERSPAATEGFFALTPRAPHALRLVFHLLQAPFVALRWSLASVRLLSIAAAAAAVVLAAAIAAKTLRTQAARLFLVAAVAVDPQLFAASHLARQEIVLVAALLAALALRARGAPPAAVAAALGLAIGVHANSFVAAAPVAALYALDVAGARCGERGAALGRALVFVGTLAVWAAAWLALSRVLDPGFPRAYVAFGGRYGVGDSLPVKLLGLRGFYARLYLRIGGTYHVPDVRLPLLLFAAAAVAAVLLLVARAAFGKPAVRRVAEALAMLVAANIGLVAIGKYSQPSVVLVFPVGYLLVAALFDAAARRLRAASRWPVAAATAGLAIALGFSTAAQAAAWLPVRYDRYLARIRAHVSPTAAVIGPLNSAFAFEPGRLHAFADLEALQEARLTVADYVERFGIEYILYPEELDRVYAERPLWNDLHGNIAPWYPELRRFLEERCVLAAEWEEPVFAMRMVAYSGRGPWRFAVYRVLPPAGR